MTRLARFRFSGILGAGRRGTPTEAGSPVSVMADKSGYTFGLSTGVRGSDLPTVVDQSSWRQVAESPMRLRMGLGVFKRLYFPWPKMPTVPLRGRIVGRRKGVGRRRRRQTVGQRRPRNPLRLSKNFRLSIVVDQLFFERTGTEMNNLFLS